MKKILQVVNKEALLLRSIPKELSISKVNEMILKLGFYDRDRNPKSKGFEHKYYFKETSDDKVVFDETTGLMWQQIESSEKSYFEDVKKYIDELNMNSFAGFNDWRLSTLEESMSLMEPEQKNEDWYIDPVFDSK